MTQHGSGWLRWFLPARPAASATLLLLPHAGGSAHTFVPWVPRFPASVRLAAVEYPGHGTRYREPLPVDLDGLIEALLAAVLAEIDGSLIVLGHSLGAVLGFELAWRLESSGYPLTGFVASGARAPHRYSADPGRLHLLSDDHLAEELHRRGYIPGEVLRNHELRELLVPVIRNDLALGERYRFGPQTRRLSCPVSVIGGDADAVVPVPDLHAWQEVAVRPQAVHVIPGGHFYYLDRLDDVVRAVRDVLPELESGPPSPVIAGER